MLKNINLKLVRMCSRRLFKIISKDIKTKTDKFTLVHDKELPKYINGYCHIYSEIVSSTDENYEPFPVIVVEFEYERLIAHFAIINKETNEIYDPAISEDKKENYDYIILPDEFKRKILEHDDPDHRLLILKYSMVEFTKKKLDGIYKVIWKILPNKIKIKAF